MDRNFHVSDPCAQGRVVPYVGTWIEIMFSLKISKSSLVVPYVGTWIEIENY